MNALIINMSKGMRLDLTAQMKDADDIIAAFRVYGIQFEKKFTSLNTNAPSTITFKGIRPEGTAVKLTDMIEDLHARAKRGDIGNVYLQFKSYFQPKKEKKPEEGTHETSPIGDIVYTTSEAEDPTL